MPLKRVKLVYQLARRDIPKHFDLWRSWLRHCARSRKAEGWIPDDGRTVVLGSTQSLTEMSNGKGKGKAIPLQAWTDPECSRRLRLPDFKAVGI